MVVLIIILMVVITITVDLLIRFVTHKMRRAREEKKRREALDIGLKLDFKEEAPSLKRVEVENPQAVILAVDDEAVVLESFRKILVLAGYTIDTVETGPEAVGLVRKRDYDFVFTDLKMPGMDGLEVTKAVKHLRPDVDVVMITGYATIESAVEAMKYGALDYIQKPFTEDELVGFVGKLVFRRQAKREAQMRPSVQVISSLTEVSPSQRVFSIPAGFFISPGHCWLTIETNGLVRIGCDDFALKTIGPIDEVRLPEIGQKRRRGDPLATFHRKGQVLVIPCPLNGEVVLANLEVQDHLELLKMKPYELGWLCCLKPSQLMKDLPFWKIGKEAESWYQGEIDRYRTIVRAAEGPNKEGLSDENKVVLWPRIAKLFEGERMP